MIGRIAARLGYRVSRLSGQPDSADPFSTLQGLMQGTREPIIFDVGAHHGHIALEFRRRFPESKIYAFEPFKASFEKLRANTASDPGIHTFNFGLSNQAGTLSFHSNPSSATNSLLPTDRLGSKTWAPGLLETEEIVDAQFKTIDQVLESMGIPKLDILKLDVQGAEHLVIEGASTACAEGKIQVVYSEIITQPTYKNQKRLDHALATFYDTGFDLHNIFNMNLSDQGKLRQIDAIFTRNQDSQLSHDNDESEVMD